MIQDIIFTDDIQFTANGDLLVEFSEDQHIEHILKSGKGNFYQSPEIGVNITELMNGNAYAPEIKRVIRENLVLDDYRILKINIDFNTSGELQTEIQANKIK